jgi:hypothetical protein
MKAFQVVAEKTFMAQRIDGSGQRLLCICTLLVLMQASLGCSRTGTVSGTVKFKDRPLRAGTVIFHCQDGIVLRAPIDKNGTYSLPAAPLGPVQITVVIPRTRQLNMSTEGAPVFKDLKQADKAEPEDSTEQIAIPLKYRDPETSGLSFTVEGGSQTKDLDLVDSD